VTVVIVRLGSCHLILVSKSLDDPRSATPRRVWGRFQLQWRTRTAP